MEVRLRNVTIDNKRKILLNRFNLKLKSSTITGIYGDKLNLLANLLTKKINYSGLIEFNNQDINIASPKIICLENLTKDTFMTRTVSDEFYLKCEKITQGEHYLAKIISVLKMVGLSEKYLKREIKTLSKSEKRLIAIALSLIIEPDIIIFQEPFLYLDNEGEMRVKKIINNLKKKYQKMVIIVSMDANVLYELTDYLIIFKDNQVLTTGRTLSLFSDMAYLEKNNIMLPNMLLFKKIAATYNKEIPCYKTVDELVKGVYKDAYQIKEEA